MLEHCPFCQIAAKASGGEHCVKGTYTLNQFQPETVQVIVLKEHTDQPTEAALIEAAKMAEGGICAEVRDVAGHWGVKITRPDWVQKPKASTKTGPEGQVYDNLK
jgi:hypothetical protein